MVDLKNRNECSGCRACEKRCPQNAIRFVEDSHGFFYPSIDRSKCVQCGICDNICAFDTDNHQSILKESTDIYGVKIKDDSKRADSTSGGFFTAISDYVLENNGVVYGAVLDESMNVIHARAESEEIRNRMRGSKYVQSNTLNTFSEAERDLLNGRMVLYSGTPCQIAGLKLYLGKEYSNLLTIDVVCHGVPSNKLFKEFIQLAESKTGKKVKSFLFRDKSETGWEKPISKLIYYNGYSCNFSGRDCFFELFNENLPLRPSCLNCKFIHKERASDFSIADYWGINNRNAAFNDNKGVSMVLINSEKAKVFFESIGDNIDFFKSDMEDRKFQGRLSGRNSVNPNTERFWDEYDKRGFEYVLKKYTDYSAIHKLKKKIKNRADMYLHKVKR